MLNYKLLLSEQETTITFTRTDSEAVLYTSDRLRMAKLDKLCQQYPEVYRCTWTDNQIMGDGVPMGKKYAMPVKYLRFGKPASVAKREAGRKAAARLHANTQKA